MSNNNLVRPSQQELDPRRQAAAGFGEMKIAENNPTGFISVEPMFGQGNDYYSHAVQPDFGAPGPIRHNHSVSHPP